MLVSVIIVHYKTPELTAQCLDHIYKASLRDDQVEVIIVDNDSQDEAGFALTRDFPQIKWIESPENIGFGRANNLGVEVASGAYILLLNSDVILNSSTLHLCLNHAQRIPNLGVLGCQLLNEDETNQKSVWHHVGDFTYLWKQNLLLQKLWPLADKEIKGIGGAFMLIPKKVLDQVGGFDPDFFMYSEELELCHRIRKARFELVFYPEASAIHLDGGSGEGTSWSQRHKHLSNALLYYKIKGFFGYLLFLVFRICNTAMNFASMWFIDKQYRKAFWNVEYYFYANFARYLTIPFLYSLKTGNGKRQLRLSR